MNLAWVIVIVLLVLAFAGAPNVGPWGAHSYGYYPSGLLTIIVVVLVILLLTGRL